MRTRNIVLIVIVIILVALGLWWASAAGKPGSGSVASSTTQMATSTATTTASASNGGSASTSGSTGSSLSKIASQTNNFTCTITAGGASGQTTGTVYGAGGKIRADFSIPSNNGSVTGHVIRSNGYAYSWVDGQSTGTKTAVSTNTNVAAPGQGGVISLDSATASECHPWSPDTTQFVPPKGITFVAR